MDRASRIIVLLPRCTIFLSNRRFTRLTNSFSKNLDKKAGMLNLFFLRYNLCRIHKTLGVTLAMEAGIPIRFVTWNGSSA